MGLRSSRGPLWAQAKWAACFSERVQKSPKNAQAGCAGLVVETVTGHAADSGDLLDKHLEENVQAASLRLTDQEYENCKKGVTSWPLNVKTLRRRHLMGAFVKNRNFARKIYQS